MIYFQLKYEYQKYICWTLATKVYIEHKLPFKCTIGISCRVNILMFPSNDLNDCWWTIEVGFERSRGNNGSLIQMFEVAKRFFLSMWDTSTLSNQFGLPIRRTLHPSATIFTPCSPDTLGERERERERNHEVPLKRGNTLP